LYILIFRCLVHEGAQYSELKHPVNLTVCRHSNHPEARTSYSSCIRTALLLKKPDAKETKTCQFDNRLKQKPQGPTRSLQLPRCSRTKCYCRLPLCKACRVELNKCVSSITGRLNVPKQVKMYRHMYHFTSQRRRAFQRHVRLRFPLPEHCSSPSTRCVPASLKSLTEYVIIGFLYYNIALCFFPWQHENTRHSWKAPDTTRYFGTNKICTQ
jgi:hypothetical protein